MKRLQWNRDDIKYHLRSAVDSLVPDVLDQIDLTTPQEQTKVISRVSYMKKRARVLAGMAAACLCLVVAAGGTYTLSNNRIDSVIGIDVNPSIELSINRKNKVLKAQPLSQDAVIVMDGMELEGVDLNIAVNALIGSMVKQGYFDDLDNAILVTVSNEDAKKASDLRQTLVGDIEASLEENQVQAVVYDQQALPADDVTALAETYGISYGKAYFLKELIDQNDGLSQQDLQKFANMTMEEIAGEIASRSYNLGEHSQTQEESSSQETTKIPESTTLPTETTEQTTPAETTKAPETTTVTTPAVTTPAETTTALTEGETEGGKRARIDNVDFEFGQLDITFDDKVRWKNPTISVYDSDGISYAARFVDNGQDSCTIAIDQVEGGKKYTFTIGGVAPRNGGSTHSVNGRFEAPDISPEATLPPPQTEETSEEETESTERESTAGQTQTPSPTTESTLPESSSESTVPESVAALS